MAEDPTIDKDSRDSRKISLSLHWFLLKVPNDDAGTGPTIASGNSHYARVDQYHTNEERPPDRRLRIHLDPF